MNAGRQAAFAPNGTPLRSFDILTEQEEPDAVARRDVADHRIFVLNRQGYSVGKLSVILHLSHSDIRKAIRRGRLLDEA